MIVATRSEKLGPIIEILSLVALSAAIGYLAMVLANMVSDDWLALGPFGLVLLTSLVLGVSITWLTSRGRPQFLSVVFVSAYTLRVVLAVILYYYLVVHLGQGGFEGNDDIWWDLRGWAVASGERPFWEALTEFSGGYVVFNAAVYALAGHYPLNVRIGNAFVGALIPVAGYHLSRTLFGHERIARYTAIWLALFPSLIFFSAVQQKDILLALAMTTGGLAIAKAYRRGLTCGTMMLFLASLGVAVTIRSLAAYLLAAGVLSIVVFRLRDKRIPGLIVVLGGLVLVFIVVLIAWLSGAGLTSEAVVFYAQNRGFVFVETAGFIASQSAGLNAILFRSPALLRLIIGPGVFLLGPFPPSLRSGLLSYSFLSLATPLWFALLPWLVLACLRALRQRSLGPVVATILLPVVSVSLIQAYLATGTIPRQRVMIEPLILTAAAWAFYSSPERRIRYLLWSLGFSIVALILYLSLRLLFVEL